MGPEAGRQDEARIQAGGSEGSTWKGALCPREEATGGGQPDTCRDGHFQPPLALVPGAACERPVEKPQRGQWVVGTTGLGTAFLGKRQQVFGGTAPPGWTGLDLRAALLEIGLDGAHFIDGEGQSLK